MKHLHFYFPLLFIAIIISCNTTKKTSSSQSGGSELLFRNQWKLSEVQGTTAPENSKAMLVFIPGEKNLVTGSTGCNRVTGSFVLSEDHHLKFSPLATTKMACLDQRISALEHTFLDALGRATTWWADSSQLLLKNGDTVLAKFSAAKTISAEQEKLNGNWELNFIAGNEQSFDTIYPERKPTIVFSLPLLQVGGNSSCNGFGTEAKIDGNNISFKDPISTMMACPGNGEQLFFKTLKSITAFKLNDDHSLTLFAGNVAAMRFSKK